MNNNKKEMSIAIKNETWSTDFESINIPFEDIPLITCKNHYTNLLFAGGKRKGGNFLSAHFLIVDVDDGYPISKVLEILTGYRSIIVTTRSHRHSLKDGKVIKPTDRYRILIDIEKPIHEALVYQQIIKGLIKEFNGDEKCFDTGRFYYCNPNQNIHLIKGDKYWDITQYLDIKDENTLTFPTDNKKEEVIPKAIQLEGNMLIKVTTHGEIRISDLFHQLTEKENCTLCCPISPETHKNMDANPSCSAQKNGKWLNFHCYVCNKNAYYKPLTNKKKNDQDTYSVAYFNKADHLHNVRKGLKKVSTIIEEIVKFLPQLKKDA